MTTGGESLSGTNVDDLTILVCTYAPCPECDTRINAKLAPRAHLEDILDKYEDTYDRAAPAALLDEYEQPVYLFCTARACPWHGLLEREKALCVLPGRFEPGAANTGGEP